MPSPTVLVVEDDPGILRLLEVSLELEGFSVLLAHDGAEGIEVACAAVPDVVVSDVSMPRASGLELWPSSGATTPPRTSRSCSCRPSDRR